MGLKKYSDLSTGHINESDTALYVDSLLKNNFSNLPPVILSHVEICSECKDKILDVFLYLRNSRFPTKSDIDEPLILKEKKRAQKNIHDPNFKVNPNLEYMINSQLRNVSIQIFSPENNSSLKKEIEFAWKPTPNKNLQVKILDNKNNVILQYSIKKNKFILKEKLSPGLYYWKLENQSDLLYVGKFYITDDSTSPPK